MYATLKIKPMEIQKIIFLSPFEKSLKWKNELKFYMILYKVVEIIIINIIIRK